MKAKRYYVLLANDGHGWAPQFGDYDRDTVTEELRDMRESESWRGAKFRTLATMDSQTAIDSAVAELNAVRVAGVANV